jgi:ribosome-binding factor A
MSLRTERMSEALREELMCIIQQDLKDPAIGITSITHVRVSHDLKHAWISLSVLGDDDQQDDALRVLRKASGFLRRELGSRIRMRLIPDLIFEIDRAAEHSVKISRILKELETDSETGDADE